MPVAFHTNEHEHEGAKTVIAAARIFFEFLRNALIVVALEIAAQKSGNAFLFYFAKISYGVMVAYCYSYFLVWRVDFPGIRRIWLRSTLRITLDIAVPGLIAGALWWLVANGVAAIVEDAVPRPV